MLMWFLLMAIAVDGSDTRPGLQRALDGMAAAAVAGDPAGYLRHVAGHDIEFLHEQTYFANDLAKKPPAEIRFELREVEGEPATPQVVADGVVEAPINVRWSMPGKDGPGKERVVTFTARFVRADAAEPAWLYAGEAWNVSSSPGVCVLYDDGLDALAVRTAEAFAAVRGSVEEEFELTHTRLPQRVQKVKLYGTMLHLQQSITLSYAIPLGGWNEPGESIKLLANARTAAAQLRVVIAHEYGHVATFDLGPRANSIPWWLIEGMAEVAAQPYAKNGELRRRLVARWAKDEKLAAWDDITDFDRTPAKLHGKVYPQGQAMALFVTERFGRSARNRWLVALAAGRSMDEASRDVLGTSFEDLDREWHAWLAATADEGGTGKNE